MASLPHTRTVTYEEWLTMPEVQDATEEVVIGDMRIIPPAKLVHALIVQRLFRALDRQLDPAEYTRAHILAAGDHLKPRLFPHVQVDIAQIWPD